MGLFRTNGTFSDKLDIFGLFRTNGIFSDQWDFFRPMSRRTNDTFSDQWLSDQWHFFGPMAMGLRTNGFSDQWAIGPMLKATIQQLPYMAMDMVAFTHGKQLPATRGHLTTLKDRLAGEITATGEIITKKAPPDHRAILVLVCSWWTTQPIKRIGSFYENEN